MLEGCVSKMLRGVFGYMERSGPMSHWPGLLLATGTEDYFDDAYTFESTLDERPGQHTFYEEDAVRLSRHFISIWCLFALFANLAALAGAFARQPALPPRRPLLDVPAAPSRPSLLPGQA